MPDQESPSSQERLIIAAVGLMAVVTMVFGFWGIKKTIVFPFSQQGQGDYKTPEEREEEAVAILKETDTDRDGISDYEENYVFRTNPYLEDTDSDGLPDGEEIAKNTNPNCPEGSACQVARTVDPAETAGQPAGGETAVTEAEAQALAFIEVFGDPRELTREQAAAKVQAMSTEDMRAFFIRMGVPQEAVEQADNAALRQLALEALKEITFANDLTSGSEE